MVCDGLSAWSRAPELYQNTSVISPVDNRVLTMLSPWLPPGCCSILSLILGLAFMKPFASAVDVATVDGSLPVMNDRVTLPPAPELEADPQELRAATARAVRAAPSALGVIFIVPLR